MFEHIEKLRRAPEPAKQRVVAFVTIAAVAVITILWFALSLPNFFRKGAFNLAPAAASTTPAVATDTPPIQAPFSE
jgi:hypothetical protein